MVLIMGAVGWASHAQILLNIDEIIEKYGHPFDKESINDSMYFIVYSYDQIYSKQTDIMRLKSDYVKLGIINNQTTEICIVVLQEYPSTYLYKAINVLNNHMYKPKKNDFIWVNRKKGTVKRILYEKGMQTFYVMELFYGKHVMEMLN
jgi:hypothetical protein